MDLPRRCPHDERRFREHGTVFDYNGRAFIIQAGAKTLVYELRIYHIHKGRMAAIHNRFANVTLGMFARHGIGVVDFWEDGQGHERLYYVLEYPDADSRDARWNAFASDPDWQAAKRSSEEDGPIVERIESYLMTRVPYSPARHD